MKSLLATIAIVGTVAFAAPSTEVEKAFQSFLAKEGKNYGTKQEYSTRLNIFSDNYHSVMHHNMFKKEDTGIELGLNKFADLTSEEFGAMMNGYKGTRQARKAPVNLTGDVQPELDWRVEAVSPIKDQGQCGSCWAFSTTGALEGAYIIKHQKLVSFSEQQLVDCSGSYGNQGCNGGLMDNAFKYAEKTPVEFEASYKYTARQGSCKAKKSLEVVKVTDYVDVKPNDPVALRAAVFVGPVSVAIDASSSYFQHYKSGVMKQKCGTNLDHGVLVVGYLSDNGQDNWVLKNSWGPAWGEGGYFRMARDMNQKGPGQCGIQKDASYPIVA